MLQDYQTGNKKLDEKIRLSLLKDPVKNNRLVRLEQELEELREKKNKYNVVGKEDRTYSDGTVFASKGEMQRWHELVLYQKQGLIIALQKQIPFVLQEAFISNQYGDIPAITYVADFTYIDSGLRKGFAGRTVVEDSKGKYKGARTEVFKVKRKLFLKLYPHLLFFES